jgi:hypothetical protein
MDLVLIRQHFDGCRIDCEKVVVSLIIRDTILSPDILGNKYVQVVFLLNLETQLPFIRLHRNSQGRNPTAHAMFPRAFAGSLNVAKRGI